MKLKRSYLLQNKHYSTLHKLFECCMTKNITFVVFNEKPDLTYFSIDINKIVITGLTTAIYHKVIIEIYKNADKE